MNGKKVLSVLRNKMSGVCAMALMLFTLASGSVFAQSAQTIEIPGDGISWSGLGTSIMTTLTGAAVVAIGVALAIWIMMTGLRLLTRKG